MIRKFKTTALILSFALVFSGLCGRGSEEAPAETPESVESAEAEIGAEEENGAEPEAEEDTESDSNEAGDGNANGVEFNGHSYQYIDTAVSWTEAHDLCNSLGGHLVTITSPEEQAFIESEFNGQMVWIGAYNNGAYGGDKNVWRWVSGEEWNYKNFSDGEPSNSSGEEWFGCLWKEMKWNDLREGDPGNRLSGFICEYDDQPDVFEGGEIVAAAPKEEPKEEKEQEEDPRVESIGKGKSRIYSKSRRLSMTYPSNYRASADGDALYVYDGDAAYLIARNITDEVMNCQGDMKEYCKKKAEDEMKRNVQILYGKWTDMDNVKREGADGKNRVCKIRANIWNGKADVNVVTTVSTHTFKDGSMDITVRTGIHRFNDKTSGQHVDNCSVGAYR